jgi:hypothetical protein
VLDQLRGEPPVNRGCGCGGAEEGDLEQVCCLSWCGLSEVCRALSRAHGEMQIPQGRRTASRLGNCTLTCQQNVPAKHASKGLTWVLSSIRAGGPEHPGGASTARPLQRSGSKVRRASGDPVGL